MFIELEPWKPLVTKPKKKNQGIYQTHHMIDQVLIIEEEFSSWFTFAADMGASVGINPDKPRATKRWSDF